MNKTAIKNFATWARRDLIERVSNKALQYGITKGNIEDASAGTVGGTLLTIAEQEQRKALVSEINAKGYDEVMEEVAYTWFNRFIAMRYMEVNNYLPSKVRVFSDEEGKFNPQILAEALHLDLPGLDMEKVYAFKEKNDNEGLYKYLIITQCNALNEILPGMFQKIDDYTELLLTDNLLRDGSVLEQMVSGIPEEDWQDAVQIIGWMYQYYNAELNNVVYDGNMSRSRINKELIPAATTIYTPDWAVRYMVENSLGKLWYEGHKTFDKSQWKYYLDEAEQEPEVEAQLAEIRKEYETIRPEDIKVIDPCMGSGHILVYAFDVLMQIYTSAGWSERDAAKSIVENNIYGLDIDDRAGQLSYFAIMMKARQYSRRIFSADVKPMVYAIQDSSFMTQDLINYVANGDSEIAKSLNYIKTAFKDAKELGSIIDVKPVDFASLYMRIEAIRADNIEDLFSMIYQQETIDKLLPLIKQAEVMAQKYDVAITNPPYLGNSRFSSVLDSFVKKHYELGKTDLCTVMYMRLVNGFSKRNGFISMITTSSWMFLSSYEKLRENMYGIVSIDSMVDFGTELFEGKVGHNPIVSWVSRKSVVDYKMTSIRLVDYCYSQKDLKKFEFYNTKNKYYSKQSNYKKIPGAPVAYWVNDKVYKMYDGSDKMEELSHPKVGMQTSNNEAFLRVWYEIKFNEFNGDSKNLKWIKYLKGGAYRKWYGNLEYLLFYNYSPSFILKQKNARVLDLSFLDKSKCTWTDLTSGYNSFRFAPRDTFYDISGHCFFPKESDQYWLLGYANTNVFSMMLKVFNSTMHCQVGDVAKVVVPELNSQSKKKVDELSRVNVKLSKTDWDAFETSWDFKKHPLI